MKYIPHKYQQYTIYYIEEHPVAVVLEVMLIHPASAGHGLNLQSGGNMIVWFSVPWSLELYEQTVDRLYRQGQKAGTVSVIHIVTENTIDRRVLQALKSKDSTQSALIDAVKAVLK